jgi:hypothetical protein
MQAVKLWVDGSRPTDGRPVLGLAANRAENRAIPRQGVIIRDRFEEFGGIYQPTRMHVGVEILRNWTGQ